MDFTSTRAWTETACASPVNAVTRDGMVVFTSETGVLPIPDDRVEVKGALRPGQMILLDPVEKLLVTDYELKTRLARQ